MHLVDFNMRKASSWHLFKVFIIVVKQVRCIHTNADGALNNDAVTNRLTGLIKKKGKEWET